MTNEEIRKKYLDFLYEPKNIFNCEECPYNEGITSSGRIAGPCGQQNCWIQIHCQREEEC